MIETIVYFGIAQSLFAAALFLTKNNVKIADKISAAWLITMSYSFIVNAIKLRHGIVEELWVMSVIPVLTYSQYLFLYTKYISREYEKFQKKDYLHFLPALGGIIFVILLYAVDGMMNFKTFVKVSNENVFPRFILGNAFLICLWTYSIATFIRIRNYKKQITNFYSFESEKISLNWLLLLAVSFFIAYHIIIVVSSFHIGTESLKNVEIFRSGVLLLFVYILSFGGLRQRQLISEEKKTVVLNEVPNTVSNIISSEPTTSVTSSDRYKKSGLKDEQADIYLKQLIDYMNQSEAWKDNELSVAKLSEQTGIQKHYITQVLNEVLNKNFYTFVNEYRTEHAKKLIKSPRHENWSFLAIAYECGFNSKSAFNSFFKKYTDMTPTEFKNQQESLTNTD